MIKSPKFIILLLCLYYLFVSQAFGQAEKELNPPEYIKTISFKTSQENYLTNLPIVKLGETFTLDFDVLLNSEADYYYTIDQLNFDWSKSQLIKSEYLRGFDNVKIQNYKTSFNTYQIYSHYKLEIPNQDVRITKSGNYILRPSAGFELGIDLSPSSDVSLNYVSDPNTKYTKSIDQQGEKSIKGKIGFDVLHNNGWSLMTFYERNQSENSHSDTLYFLTGYVSSKEEEYAMALNDKKASIEYKRNVNGFDISFDTAYDLFAENSGYEINLKISNIF